MKLGLIFFFLNLALICQSQFKLLNASLITPEVQIANLGFDNKIKIIGIEIDSTFLLVASSDTIVKQNGYYTYTPKGKIVAERLSLMKNNLIVYSTEFKLERLQEPNFYLGQLRDSMVSKKELSLNPGLIASYEPQVFKSEISVTSFEANIQKKCGRVILLNDSSSLGWENWSEKKLLRYEIKNDPFKYGGKKFSKKQLRKICRMNKGDILNITTLTFLSPSSCNRKKTVNLKFIIE